MADDDQETVVRKSGMIYGAITSLVVSIIAMLGIGWALDRWLGIGPWGIVGGILLGSVVGFYQFIKIISKIS